MPALTSIHSLTRGLCRASNGASTRSPGTAVLMDETPLVRVHHATSEKLF